LDSRFVPVVGTSAGSVDVVATEGVVDVDVDAVAVGVTVE
jgi:hypothetical protein